MSGNRLARRWQNKEIERKNKLEVTRASSDLKANNQPRRAKRADEERNRHEFDAGTQAI